MGMLNHLGKDPPGVILGVLRLLEYRVLKGGGGVGASTRGELWREGVLLQLMDIAKMGEEEGKDGKDGGMRDQGGEEEVQVAGADISDGDGEGGDKKGREDKVKKEKQQQQEQQEQKAVTAMQQAGEMATSILLQLLTDPHQGLLTGTSSTGQTTTASTPAAPAAVPGGSGEMRALWLLQKLQPGSSKRHARVLQAVAAARPDVAADLVQLLGYNLEPQPLPQWVGAMEALGGLVRAARAAPCGVQERAAAAAAAAEAFATRCSAAAAAGGCGGEAQHVQYVLLSADEIPHPPGTDSVLVRAAVRRCYPPVLTKALLSRGLQHGDAAVVLTSLTVMADCMDALIQLMAAAQNSAAATTNAAAAAVVNTAAAAAGGEGDPGAAAAVAAVAAAWQGFAHRLQGSVRAKLPEPSVLVAILTQLQKVEGGAAGPAAAGAGGQGGGGQDGNTTAEIGGAVGWRSTTQQQQQQQPHDDVSWQVLSAPLLLHCLSSYCCLVPRVLSEGQLDLVKLVLTQVRQGSPAARAIRELRVIVIVVVPVRL